MVCLSRNIGPPEKAISTLPERKAGFQGPSLLVQTMLWERHGAIHTRMGRDRWLGLPATPSSTASFRVYAARQGCPFVSDILT
jgi:hypothetical protein